MDRSPNLLDQALGLHDGESTRSGRVVLVEDCVETSAAFVLHHLIKRSLSPLSSSAVIFVAFAQPFSHYDRILRKMVLLSLSLFLNLFVSVLVAGIEVSW